MISVIAIEDESTALLQLKESVAQVPELELKASFKTITEALVYVHAEGRVNLVLCDIELPGVSGLDAVDLLRKHCDELVFVTGHGEHALSAYRKRVKAFLVKPVTAADLLGAVEDILNLNAETRPMEIRLGKLWLYDASKRRYIPTFPDKVVKLIHHGNNMLVYLKGEEQPVIVRQTVGRAMAVLHQTGLFMQINPGAIVNMNEVTEGAPKQVEIGGEEHEVTAAYLDEYNKFLGWHQFGLGNKIR